MALRAILLATAGLASLAYLALRPKPDASVTRELDLASLERHVENWLPKLPYVPFIRLGIAGTAFLELTGSDTAVLLHRLRTSHPREREFRQTFRSACKALGLEVREPRTGPEGADLCCEGPTTPALLAQVLDALLRDVFHVQPQTRLVATIPVGAGY